MNPLKLAEEIEERYRRYLRTTFYFKDPILRRSFENSLGSGHLRKGPYLEATPVFKRGASARDVFAELLGSEPLQGFLNAVQGARPLYWHQEESIRRVSKGRNAIVATGTGSGKTESFLYPILLHLYQEFEAQTLCPGVRALVLYPMNALANDQRERLGEICKQLADESSSFRFTFGQYIGETPEDKNDSHRNARDQLARRLPGELVLRSEMRAEPPHILLTNYSMLEYLLLRPDDSLLFDDGRAQWWTFLVLDEAHQYRGARGIEMAMLLRRLKRRLRDGGHAGPFRCLATSATLIGGQGDKSGVAKFATDLFGETFSEQDVILGQVEPVLASGVNSLAPKDYESLSHGTEDGAPAPKELLDVATKVGAAIAESDDYAAALGRVLQQDGRTSRLRRLVTGQPVDVCTVADQVFADLASAERVSALSHLVALLLRARDPVSTAPLLSARYHLFLRSLEGAFLSFWPEPTVLLDRRTAGDEALFEVGLCRECGQHYLVGKVIEGKLVEAVRDPGRSDFGATFFLPVHDMSDQDDEEHAEKHAAQGFRLCIRCSEICRSSEQLRCDHNASILVLKQAGAEEREDQIPRCAVCGYQAPDPVREVVHGTDGPHSVIATTLYQQLPETRKKVLAFADGRQEAAFFAWYLEHSYKDILGRNLLFKVAERQVMQSADGSSFTDLATGLRDLFRERGIFGAAVSDLQLRREAWLRLYREFLTDEPRISLDGVGLVRWYLKWPAWFETPAILTKPPWALDDQQARDVAFTLLNSMRIDRAVEIRTESAVSLAWNDLDIQASQMRVRIGPPARPQNSKNWPVRSWDGTLGKRVRLLAKLFMRIKPDVNEQEAVPSAVDIARAVWESFRECDERAPTSNDRMLIPVEDARRLNPDWWRLRLVAASDVIYRCDTCGRLQTISVYGICLRHRCPGTLKEIRRRDLEPNHYRLLYEAELPGSLHVEEHTAQLDKEKAREFQRDFRDGKIHVLSCSTTFELGVDLGDLDTVFLRNVPPEAFNYAQRIGRSGRRSGFPGFAVTYCRRGPHDLYHFSEPLRMMTGKVQPPVLALRNEKIITRHITALALSFFFRAGTERFVNVESLFKDLKSPCGVVDFRKFLFADRHRIEETLRHVLPREMENHLGLSDGSWIDKITGQAARFALAEAEVSSDYKTVLSVEENARNARDYRTAEWARRRADTIAKKEVLSFLSRKAVIPKYGFPVDVVELDTQRTQQNQEAFEISLQRDLSIAISEFAPTSKLVANKKEWTSYGLKKVAEKEWPRRMYARCQTHNVFLHWRPGEPEPITPCGDPLQPYTYVIPQFGFVTDKNRPENPKARPPKVFSTRPYFAGPLGPEPGLITMPAHSPLVTLRKASPGLMVVLCEGRRGGGFYLCSACGAGFRNRQRSHKTPQDQECRGTLEQVSLGQEFVTDVLQLQFRIAPQDETKIVPFAFSLAYAVVEGAAEVLEVPSIDLSTTVGHSDQHPLPPIILYDNVPGGAGLVARLEREEVLKDCLQSAMKRVEGGCGCAPNMSCYGCLRSYRNQFAHQLLQRGPVLQYLMSVLSGWR